jgi:hypothetical protein
MKYLPSFLKLREIDLFLALYDLPFDEYYEFEKNFMNNRKINIENDMPFISVNFKL